MGAHEFAIKRTGSESKIPKIFNELVSEDRFQFGDDAYTGDIGQKYGYETVNLPKGRLINKAYKMLANIGWLRQEAEYGGKRDETRYAKAVVEAAAYFGMTPSQFEALAARYDDKWNQTAILLVGARNLIFCGMAAS
jgi:hypothetical protein